MKRRVGTYADLGGRKLADIGVHDIDPNIRNTISRGMFAAVFLTQCFEAIEVERLASR